MLIMKTPALILILIASMLSLAATAQTATDNSAVTITAPLRIDAPSQYHRMQPQEYYDYLRSYDLSNGMTLNLYSRGRKIYAEVADQGRHEIVATAQNVFVALDQQLKMTINLHGDDASGELIMALPSRHLAKGDASSQQLVAVAFR
jgi:alpha-amylase/alpha-mannosidase (GH57 family)